MGHILQMGGNRIHALAIAPVGEFQQVLRAIILLGLVLETLTNWIMNFAKICDYNNFIGWCISYKFWRN